MTAVDPLATGAKLTFTQEMRAKAMSLHTFSQAPKQKDVKKDTSSNTQMEQWQTTKGDFLQFLVDSLVVYTAYEEVVQKPELARLRNSGLERVEGLNKDIVFIQNKYGLTPPAPSLAATEYASYVKTLETNVFVTHFYNYYFAHTAGGRMIGQTVMDTVFEGHLFDFYQWKGDVKQILEQVKGQIDTLASSWTRAQKDAALDATPETFMKSGALLRVLVGKARDRAARMYNKVEVKGGLISKVPPAAYSTRKAAWDL